MNKRILFWLAIAGAVTEFVALSSVASAAEWGTIKGKFVYQGKYDNKPLTLTKDPEFCGKHNPVDEKIVLGKDGGLQNAFVYLYVAPGKKVEIHPDYKATDLKPKVLDNKGCRFEPHAMTLWTAQPLEIHNSDAGIGHNTNANTLRANRSFNDAVSNDSPLVKNFTKSESVPSPVACSIHPWMTATILIRDNPYMAVSGEDGTFEIKNVPAGKQEFTLWHEAKGYMKDVKAGDGKTNRKGELKVTIPDGGTLDLGEIKVAPETLGQ